MHPRNHTALFLDAELSARLQLPGGLYFDLGAGAGYYHTWLGGEELYVRGDGGTVATATDWGRPGLKAGASGGFGWDLRPASGHPLELFGRIDLFIQYPFNNSVLPHAAFLAGAAYAIRGAE